VSDRPGAVIMFMRRTADIPVPYSSPKSSEQMPKAKANLDWTISKPFLSSRQHGGKAESGLPRRSP